MHINKHYLIFIFLVFYSGLISQNVIKGKIIDENGESLIGVNIKLKEDNLIGTATDFDGNYELDINNRDSGILVVSYIGYASKEFPFTIIPKQVLILDISLGGSSVDLVEVEIVAKQEKNQQYYMESIKKKSIASLDYMSGDLMKKIGDSNISSAIARIPGVSSNGSFITVRGIGDRYVKTSINGSQIPTLDPFTNNIKLDIFPTNLVDNIIITKTSSPDLSGDWCAANISIETKDYPEKLSLSVSSAFSYNQNSTFKKILTNGKSKTDWLGFDSNYRDINHHDFSSYNVSPSRYEELAVLGLSEYYRNLGVTKSWDVSSSVGETYFRLGLVELGLLGKAFINDEQEVKKAIEKYNAGNYSNDAFKLINSKSESFNKSFANNWSLSNLLSPNIHSHNFFGGNKFKLFNKEVGFLIGLRYNSSVRYDGNSVLNRTLTRELTADLQPVLHQKYDQEFTSESNGWTGILTTNLKLNNNHKISLVFMPNFIGNNSIRKGIDLLQSSTYKYDYLESQFYEERSQIISQYKSEHYIPNIRTKVDANFSYTLGKSTAPDFKQLNYYSENNESFNFDKSISNVRRNFRYLNDNILDAKLSTEFSWREKKGSVDKIKIGVSLLDQRRDFLQYSYLLQLTSKVFIPESGLNEFFEEESFSINGNKADLFYTLNNDPSNATLGSNSIYSGFLMFDQIITDRIRLSGGVRAEYASIFSDVKDFYEKDYAADDPRRQAAGITFILKPTNVQQLSYLPSLNFLYKLRKSDLSPMNLRFNYSKSLARPSLREYTENIVFDFELNADVFGNADLKFVDIDNYDIRFENYFSTGDNLTISLFYKNIQNHIELISSNLGFTWANADRSYVYGIELDGKKKLVRNLDFSANVSLVNSFTRIENRRLEISNGVKTWVTINTVERTMFGQSPLVINSILTYYFPDWGLNTSLSYNYQAPRLVLASANASLPDVYELSRHLLNFKISKKLNKYFSSSLSVKDILNSPIRRSYKYDEGFLLDFDKFTFGTSYNLSLSYNF